MILDADREAAALDAQVASLRRKAELLRQEMRRKKQAHDHAMLTEIEKVLDGVAIRFGVKPKYLWDMLEGSRCPRCGWCSPDDPAPLEVQEITREVSDLNWKPVDKGGDGEHAPEIVRRQVKVYTARRQSNGTNGAGVHQPSNIMLLDDGESPSNG